MNLAERTTWFTDRPDRADAGVLSRDWERLWIKVNRVAAAAAGVKHKNKHRTNWS